MIEAVRLVVDGTGIRFTKCKTECLRRDLVGVVQATRRSFGGRKEGVEGVLAIASSSDDLNEFGAVSVLKGATCFVAIPF